MAGGAVYQTPAAHRQSTAIHTTRSGLLVGANRTWERITWIPGHMNVTWSRLAHKRTNTYAYALWQRA